MSPESVCVGCFVCCVGLVLVSVECRLNGLGGFAVGPMVVYATEPQLQ
jgi:hypothetical protein